MKYKSTYLIFSLHDAHFNVIFTGKPRETLLLLKISQAEIMYQVSEKKRIIFSNIYMYIYLSIYTNVYEKAIYRKLYLKIYSNSEE